MQFNSTVQRHKARVSVVPPAGMLGHSLGSTKGRTVLCQKSRIVRKIFRYGAGGAAAEEAGHLFALSGGSIWGARCQCSCLGSSTPWKFCRQLTRARTQALRPRALSPFICKKTLPCCHVYPTGPNCGCLLCSKAGTLWHFQGGRGGGGRGTPNLVPLVYMPALH